MTTMPTFLQPVLVPERCYLFEAFLWVAFQRLPILTTDHEGVDIRQSDENRESGEAGYAVKVIDKYIFDDECERAGIPPDPSWQAAIDGTSILPVAHYDQMLKDRKTPKAYRKHLKQERLEAVRFESARDEWKRHYRRAIEYPASRIFVTLKDGRLPTTGKLLPAVDVGEAVEKLAVDGMDIYDIEPTLIPKSFWSLQGIDFEISAAVGEGANYCYIDLSTSDLFAVFPGERAEVVGIERVGDSFILNEGVPQPRMASRRGRPPYPWEAFHLEVASLVSRGELPAKKEAAIQQFQAWFQRELNVQPSRSAIGEKLTPYYEKFLRSNNGQKIDE
jgi:hypothetical protein